MKNKSKQTNPFRRILCQRYNVPKIRNVVISQTQKSFENDDGTIMTDANEMITNIKATNCMIDHIFFRALLIALEASLSA